MQSFIPQRGDYRKLIAFQKSICIYDIIYYFSKTFLLFLPFPPKNPIKNLPVSAKMANFAAANALKANLINIQTINLK